MRKLFLSIALLLGLVAPAFAQGINTVPQVGVINAIQKQVTYSAVSIGLVPASSATDIFCISGSTTKSVSIKDIHISGVSTANGTFPFTLLHRISLDTGGTAALTTAAPNLTLGPMSASDPAATAVLIAYTANPTIVDSSPTYARSAYLSTNTAATSTIESMPLLWSFAEAGAGFFVKSADIPRGVTGQWCINLNATTITGGLLNIDIEWTEQ